VERHTRCVVGPGVARDGVAVSFDVLGQAPVEREVRAEAVGVRVAPCEAAHLRQPDHAVPEARQRLRREVHVLEAPAPLHVLTEKGFPAKGLEAVARGSLVVRIIPDPAEMP